MSQDGSSTLTRAIDILAALGSAEGTDGEGIGVVRIARMVGREKSQVSRTLKQLAAAGLVSRDAESLRYRLGWRLFALASGAAHQHLLALAQHVLRQLVERVGERAHLTVLEGSDVLTVLSKSPPRAIQAAGWVGTAAPVHTTSSGRALLFDHTDDAVRQMIRDVEFAATAPNSPTDADDFLARLHQARRRGYVQIDEEFEPGLVGVAAPVRDFRGYTIAALNISAPKFRLNRGLPAAGREVRAAAEHLSQSLVRAPQ